MKDLDEHITMYDKRYHNVRARKRPLVLRKDERNEATEPDQDDAVMAIAKAVASSRNMGSARTAGLRADTHIARRRFLRDASHPSHINPPLCKSKQGTLLVRGLRRVWKCST